MRIGIAISRASSVEPTWTTAHIIQQAAERGHALRLIEPWDFEIDGEGSVVARAWSIGPGTHTREAICRGLRSRSTGRCYVDAAGLDLLLLRINPVDHAVMAFAQLIEALGVTVLSRPATLLKTSHKAYLATLSDVRRPRTMVSRSPGALRIFAESLGRRASVVVKPARSSGGRGVRWIRDLRSQALEDAVLDSRRRGDGYVVVQEYLPEAEAGEKRLVWLDGELLGAYLRRRAPGEFRHNLGRGGMPEPATLDASDRAIARELSPHLERDGVWLAGIDVIGGRAVEVNTLNPGGIHLIQHFTGRDVTSQMIQCLERRVIEGATPISEAGTERQTLEQR